MWDPSFMLKSCWWWVVVVVVAYRILVSAQALSPESLSLSLSKSLSHWAWVWAWLSLSAWTEPELDKIKSFLHQRNCFALYFCNEFLVFGVTCQTLTATYYVNPSMSDTEWEIERCQLYENLETLIGSWWALNMEAPLNGSASPVQTILLTKHETY